MLWAIAIVHTTVLFPDRVSSTVPHDGRTYAEDLVVTFISIALVSSSHVTAGKKNHIETPMGFP